MRKTLTPTFVAKAKVDPPDAERTIYWDEALRGFGLQVTKAGHKSFVCQYRNTAGQSRRMAIDGVLVLTEARKQAKAILGRVAKDEDPLGQRRVEAAAEAAAAKDTLRAICDEWLKRDGKKLRTKDWCARQLQRLVYPKLGSRPIADIKRTEIVRLLDRIEDENGPVMADRVLAVTRRVLNWHAARSDDFRSPIVRGMARTKPKERARERVLSDDELRAVWKAGEDTKSIFGAYVRFVLLTATRRNEAARMHRSEIRGNDWTIPGERYKTGTDHLVPLSAAARAVLATVPEIEGTDFVFSTDGRHPISGFAKSKAALEKASGVTSWTLHDLRRTARSLMSRAGVPADHAERALGHTMAGVRGTYDRFSYREEKARAFEQLAGQVDLILNPQHNVVTLRPR